MQHSTTPDPRRDFPATTPALRSQELRGHPLDAVDQRLCGGGEKTNAHVHSGGGLLLGVVGGRRPAKNRPIHIRPQVLTRNASQPLDAWAVVRWDTIRPPLLNHRVGLDRDGAGQGCDAIGALDRLLKRLGWGGGCVRHGLEV